MNTVKTLAVVPAKTNGTAEKETPTPAVKIAAITMVQKNDGEKLPPLDDRLHRLNELFAIQGRYNKLQSSLQKLKNFTFEKNGDYSGITIKDDGRNDFTTGNPEVIEEVVKFIILTIQAKIKEIEPQLKW